MWRSRRRCVIKPAYSVSFLLSINIFVWQNVLYFPNDPSIYETTKTYTFMNTAVRTSNFTRYAHTYFSVTKCENSLYVFPRHSIAPGYCVGCLQIYAALPPPCGLFCDHLAAAESPSLPSVHLFHC